MKLVIADIRDNQEWNWENLSLVLPSIIKDKIRASLAKNLVMGRM